MKKCWHVQAEILDPKTGDALYSCWKIRREWMWLDALDIVKKDMKEKSENYPDKFYKLTFIKEV